MTTHEQAEAILKKHGIPNGRREATLETIIELKTFLEQAFKH